MKLSLFDYELPQEYIAQRPVSPRDRSKLMVLSREKQSVSHAIFADLVSLLRDDDVLVLNNSKVIPARMYGVKEVEGGVSSQVEVLLLRPLDGARWEALLKPGKKFRHGGTIRFSHKDEGMDGYLVATVEEQRDHVFVICFNLEGEELSQAIHDHGVLPLPPYITEGVEDTSRYQTVYADKEGSVAAPTAGLHFTPELMQALDDKGVKFEYVDLHVGLGTFLPVKSDDVLSHKMHEEYFEMSEESASRLNGYRKEGRRIIAVGTTSVRVLESCVLDDGSFEARRGETDIFIYPGFKMRSIDGLITNFHLPKSTLLMLVSAFAGRDFVMSAYEEAKKEGYRFYSFGDAMFLS